VKVSPLRTSVSVSASISSAAALGDADSAALDAGGSGVAAPRLGVARADAGSLVLGSPALGPVQAASSVATRSGAVERLDRFM
jgi:hypothetical protein